MTKEERAEYMKAYYARNRERLQKVNREKYVKKPKDEKEEARKKRPKAYSFSHKHKGFHFKWMDDILMFEVAMPFRVQTKHSTTKIYDQRVYNSLQNEIRRRISEVDKTRKIIIMEPSYIQVYLSEIANVDAIVEVCKEFIKECTEKYGQYLTRYLGEEAEVDEKYGRSKKKVKKSEK